MVQKVSFLSVLSFPEVIPGGVLTVFLVFPCFRVIPYKPGLSGPIRILSRLEIKHGQNDEFSCFFMKFHDFKTKPRKSRV